MESRCCMTKAIVYTAAAELRGKSHLCPTSASVLSPMYAQSYLYNKRAFFSLFPFFVTDRRRNYYTRTRDNASPQHFSLSLFLSAHEYISRRTFVIRRREEKKSQTEAFVMHADACVPR